MTRDVPYESENALNRPGILDVFSPGEGGPWPVAVMLHGDPSGNDKSSVSSWARRVAQLGFVVFVPSWGRVSTVASLRDRLVANAAQAACAVAFAVANAQAYGGSPSTLILFGHSGGANAAAVIAFNEQAPTAGCLSAGAAPTISALITFDGDWLLASVGADMIDADPGLLGVDTPWAHLAARPDLPVILLSSGNRDLAVQVDELSRHSFEPPGYDRPLETVDAFADGFLDVYENQDILRRALEAQGNPVSLAVLADSSHVYIGEASWPVFLAAFERALELS